MSLSLVRPYFRNIMNAQNFVEHTDGFNIENIPSTTLDRSYHILSPSISFVQQNQNVIELLAETVIRFFLKGYNDPANAIDSAMIEEENILKSVLSSTRLSGGIKNVQFVSSTKEALADTNDNAVLVTMTFNVLIMLCPN